MKMCRQQQGCNHRFVGEFGKKDRAKRDGEMLQHEESISDALHALGNCAMRRQHRVNLVAYNLAIVYN